MEKLLMLPSTPQKPLMRKNFWKDWLRPVFGTIVFQPFALFWCWMMNQSYTESVGPFVLYSTIAFIPIYSYYERLWDE